MAEPEKVVWVKKIVRRVKRIKKAERQIPEIAQDVSPTLPPTEKWDRVFQNLISGLKNISLTIILQKPFWAFPEELIPL